MRIEVDGHGVEVGEGASVLDAVRAAGVWLPSLCHDDRLSPVGSCRTCLVRAGGIVTVACVTPASPRTQVETAGEELEALRRDAVELLVSALPQRALEETRSELAAVCTRLGIGAKAALGAGERGGDDSHPYVRLDRDLLAPGQQTRAAPARNHLALQRSQPGLGRGGLRQEAPSARP